MAVSCKVINYELILDGYRDLFAWASPVMSHFAWIFFNEHMFHRVLTESRGLLFYSRDWNIKFSLSSKWTYWDWMRIERWVNLCKIRFIFQKEVSNLVNILSIAAVFNISCFTNGRNTKQYITQGRPKNNKKQTGRIDILIHRETHLSWTRPLFLNHFVFIYLFTA